MSKRVVMACFGDARSTAMIAQHARTAEVIAVALDFGGAVTLPAMRELALASGAVRCHAVDLREEFAREVLLPALRTRAYDDPTVAFAALAPAFATRKLETIASLERAEVLAPDTVVVSARPLPRQSQAPLHFDLTFDADGLPAAINGVPMTLTELMESIETITGESALDVIEREMSRSQQLV